MIRPALILLLSLLSGLAAVSYAPSNVSPPTPEREFRGAWVATVKNIDWPSKPGLTTEQQKQELLGILDRCQQLKLNVVILQVRPACDALYESKLEPWSEYLTGVQGSAPSPFWDPLEFAVKQAHARGLELHAWFNPFRARHLSGFSALAKTHVSKTHPAWVKTYGPQLWLDPGLSEVHDYSARVILDVVNRYDIDGVHIDDYFYPYPEKDTAKKELPFPDWTSWNNYSRGGGKMSKSDWRRDNVNRFVARMYRDVKAAKPWVKVGVSPFGIYRPGFPAQIRGFDQFESLYADPRLWLANGWVDYLAPQLYWRIDAPAQSFPVLLKWWTDNNPKQRIIVAGMNTTAVGTGTNPWTANEILHQVGDTRRQPGSSGHIHWNMSALMKNRNGLADELRTNAYRETALAPAISGASARPAPPKLTAIPGSKGVEFRCESNGDSTARYWIVQERNSGGQWHTRVQQAANFTREQSPAPQSIAVRAVDKFGNISSPVVLSQNIPTAK